MVDFVLDFGNARIKWFSPGTNPTAASFDDARHAIVTLTETDWRQTTRRGKPPRGIIKVNGSPFAVGDAARRYLISERPRGASRYRDTYYKVGLGFALSECFKATKKKVTLVAGYAPADVDFVPQLIQAAKGHIEVESQHGIHTFDVQTVIPFDEPLGGYSHYVFTEKGVERARNPLADTFTLVIDVGGYTCDVCAIDPGGVIDTSSLHSSRTGVIDMMEDFEAELRGNNRALFQDTYDIDVRILETALMSGRFQFGKQVIDCSQEAEDVLNALVNDVVQIINAAGGIANFPNMLLTGGGSALVYERLALALPRANFLLAERQRENIKYANAFGGAKIAAMLRSIGEL